ncbi:hypothetical protein HHX47_DHR3000191 [Lentinula edodes]|nr:hypothetical protein HHX47_DHR3000191 [Lentinula edodes]
MLRLTLTLSSHIRPATTSRLSETRDFSSFSASMVKRKIDIVGEEGAIPRRSARATKKAKVIVFEDPASEEVEIKAVQVNSEFTESSKKKEKVKASPRDIIDLSSLPQRVSSNWKVGAHVSAAGGIENTVLNAAKIGANAFALFLKSQRKWISPPLTESSISLFKSRMKELSYNPKHILPHGSYLINLGNPDDPGSSLGIVEPSVSMAHIADCINRSHGDTSGSKVVVVLENMVRLISLAVYNSGHLSIRTFAHILADPRVQDIPLILETPSHEESSKNWDVWAKEIEVLNLLSTSSIPNTNAASDALPSRHDTTNSIENAENPRGGTNGAHKLKLDSLAQSIKDAITTAETTGRRKKATKITPKKVAKDASASRGGKKSRRGKRKEEEEEGESE